VFYSDSIKIVDYLDGFQTEARGSRTPKKRRSHKTNNSEQYAGNVLQFFPTSEGYVKATRLENSQTEFRFNYIYNHTDHLGNVRVSYTLDPQTGKLRIVDEHHYYPFGLRHEVHYPSGNRLDFHPSSTLNGGQIGDPVQLINVTKTEYMYRYNSKEWQDELGLNVYAYGWRDYDPTTGRFIKIDRFAEKYPNVSPYTYAGNNPLRFTDVKGDSLWITFGNKNQYKVLYEDGKLLNADGSAYTGKGVKVKKDGSVKIKNSFLKTTVNTLNSLGGTATGGKMLAVLQGSDNNFNITNAIHNPNPQGAVNEFVADSPNAFYFNALGNSRAEKVLTGIGSGGTIYWNPTDASLGTLNVVGGTDFNPTTNLGHELAHGWDANFGLLNTSYQQINGLNIREWRASDIENQIRGQMGSPLRSSYNGVNLLDNRNNPVRVSGTGNPTVDFFFRMYSVFN